MRTWFGPLALTMMLLTCSWQSQAAPSDDGLVGSVVTNRHLASPNDTIDVVRLDDPAVPGVSCYLSSAQTGGAASLVGMQTSPSEYSLSCFTEGAVRLPAGVPDSEVITSARRSAVFKRMYLSRLVDRQAHRLIYVAYTRYLTDGSPKHAMASVAYTP